MAVTNHQAPAQMLGYLYQVRCALNLLLSDTNEQLSICIEKFDDVAFSNDGESPSALIQTKHHINGHGDLSDKSIDLWKTIKIWIDHVSTYGFENTKFIIITTASAPENSAASLLRTDNRNVVRAFELLKQASELSDNKSNAAYYSAFSKMQADTMQRILDHATVMDNSDNIVDVAESIKHRIRYSTRPGFEDKVFERIEGWWFEKAIEALSSATPIFVSQGQVRSKICDVAAEYLPDNLPIDIVFLETVDIDELDKYEYRLIDEWEHHFARMSDELDDNSDEQKKQEMGRSLYNLIEHSTDIRIRPLCSDAFVMRGSYHMLANNLRVGWHLDFAKRLTIVLKGGGLR